MLWHLLGAPRSGHLAVSPAWSWRGCSLTQLSNGCAGTDGSGVARLVRSALGLPGMCVAGALALGPVGVGWGVDAAAWTPTRVPVQFRGRMGFAEGGDRVFSTCMTSSALRVPGKWPQQKLPQLSLKSPAGSRAAAVQTLACPRRC